jgi:molybdopterin-guanine dinucleotide biosynthesis protein A
MTAPEPVFGLVLAGGRSRRMGSDKAALLTNGETQLGRAVALLQGHLEHVFVSTNAAQADDPVRRSYPQIIDRYDDLGPVAGILSAMDEHPETAWLVLACDLPNIDDETIGYLLQNASAEQPATAFRSVNDDLPEPLCAIYRPSARAIIDRFVADGIRCPRKMLINSPTLLLTQPVPGALHNINTPDDLTGTDVDLPT